MEINYQETSKDLLIRIDIHEKYGSANIDHWTNELLNPQPGMNILDVGCGAGKLSFLFDDYTNGTAKITGGDFSEELLEKARAKNKERASNIDFQFLDFNKPFDFADNTFDLCTSAFAIYYASDLDFTFGEAHRVLRSPDAVSGNSGGRLFVSGPLPENKQMFYDIIRKPQTPQSHRCPAHPASKTTFSTLSTEFSPGPNYTNSRITSPSPKSRLSLIMCALH